MAGSEIDFLKEHVNEKFRTAETRQNEILNDLDGLKKCIPQIAREKAEETIAKTAFIKPFEKWSLIIAIGGVLVMAFASYGKLNSMMDRFTILEKRIYQEKVIENSEWINDNKKNFNLNMVALKKQLNDQNLQIELIKNTLERFYAK